MSLYLRILPSASVKFCVFFFFLTEKCWIFKLYTSYKSKTVRGFDMLNWAKFMMSKVVKRYCTRELYLQKFILIFPFLLILLQYNIWVIFACKCCYLVIWCKLDFKFSHVNNGLSSDISNRFYVAGGHLKIKI